MYKAKIISADLKDSTIEFKVEDKELTVTAGDYIIMSHQEFDELSKKANRNVVC